MRWTVLVVCLVGCIRARATVVHPTELERSTSAGGGATIARETAPSQAREESDRLGSIEVGAVIPFRNSPDSARVHLAPGLRIFSSNPETVLGGIAVGADFERFALEGSVYVGDGQSDPEVIDQAVDVFAGVKMDAPSSTIAVGPSAGLLMMPGGNSCVMLGFGLRVMGR